jgi:hypothetical protein
MKLSLNVINNQNILTNVSGFTKLALVIIGIMVELRYRVTDGRTWQRQVLDLEIIFSCGVKKFAVVHINFPAV